MEIQCSNLSTIVNIIDLFHHKYIALIILADWLARQGITVSCKCISVEQYNLGTFDNTSFNDKRW